MKHCTVLRALVLLMAGACSHGGNPGPATEQGNPTTAVRSVGTIVGRLPVVSGNIGGEPVRLVLDTGSSITCLYPATVLRVGRIGVGTSRLGGIGDTTYSVQTFGPVTLTLADVETPVRSLHGCPELPLQGQGDPPIDGVLGADALRGLAVTLDYPANVVRVLPMASDAHTDSAAALSIALVRELPVITVELQSREGWQPVSLLLDTGADATLLLSAEAAAGLELDPDPLGRSSRRGGLGGEISTRTFFISAARVGGIDVRDLAVEVAPTGLSQLQQHGIQGVAGGDFLQHFRIQLDLGNSRLGVTAPGAARSVCGSRSGICVADRPTPDGYMVRSVRPGSQAARFGIRAGETIVRVGIEPTARMSVAAMRAALRPGSELASLWIRSSVGRIRRVDIRIVE